MTDQPADQPATTKKAPTKLLVLAGAAVALVAAGAVALVALDEDSPTDVVEAYYDAVIAGDNDAARALLCAPDRDRMTNLGSMDAMTASFTPTSERITGDIAFVDGERTLSGGSSQTMEGVVRLQLIDGVWQVCTGL